MDAREQSRVGQILVAVTDHLVKKRGGKVHLSFGRARFLQTRIALCQITLDGTLKCTLKRGTSKVTVEDMPDRSFYRLDLCLKYLLWTSPQQTFVLDMKSIVGNRASLSLSPDGFGLLACTDIDTTYTKGSFTIRFSDEGIVKIPVINLEYVEFTSKPH